jgi:predicted Zn-dependent protease
MTDLMNTAYGRDEESEADERGLQTLRQAGLDPLGMPHFFERIAGDPNLPELPAFLSTHPDPGDRARHTRALAQGAEITRTLPKPKRFACN